MSTPNDTDNQSQPENVSTAVGVRSAPACSASFFNLSAIAVGCLIGNLIWSSVSRDVEAAFDRTYWQCSALLMVWGSVKLRFYLQKRRLEDNRIEKEIKAAPSLFFEKESDFIQRIKEENKSIRERINQP